MKTALDMRSDFLTKSIYREVPLKKERKRREKYPSRFRATSACRELIALAVFMLGMKTAKDTACADSAEMVKDENHYQIWSKKRSRAFGQLEAQQLRMI